MAIDVGLESPGGYQDFAVHHCIQVSKLNRIAEFGGIRCYVIHKKMISPAHIYHKRFVC